MEYPKPNNESDVFNTVNYDTSPFDIIDDEFDHETYIKNTGDTMKGILTVPKIRFNTDYSEQTTAFSDAYKSEIQTNTSKTTDIIYSNNTTTINNDLYVLNKIIFPTGTQINAFTIENKAQINSNKGNIITLNTDITNIEADITNNESAISSNAININSNLIAIGNNTLFSVNNFSLITSNTNRIVATEGRLTTNEGSISSNSSRITSTEGRITSTEGRLTNNEDKTLNLSVVGGNTINQGSLIINKDGNYLKTVGDHSWIGAYKDDDTRHYYIGSEQTGSNNLLIHNEKSAGDLILISSRDLELNATGSIILNNDLKFPDNTIQNTAFTNELKSQITSNSSSPIGSIIAFAGQFPPDGWLMCSGTRVSKTTYAELYAVIGDTYTTNTIGEDGGWQDNMANRNMFRVPDLRQSYISMPGLNTTHNNFPLNEPNQLGDFEKYSIQQHKHDFTHNKFSESVVRSVNLPTTNTNVSDNALSQASTTNSYNVDNTQISNDSVTRPNTIFLNYIIKF